MKYAVCRSIGLSLDYHLTAINGPVFMRFMPDDNFWAAFESHPDGWIYEFETDSMSDAIIFIIERYTQNGEHNMARQWLELI